VTRRDCDRNRAREPARASPLTGWAYTPNLDTVVRSKEAVDTVYWFFGLFLLPGGLPRRFTCDIHAGGRPRRVPRPLAIRSSTSIACPTASRSAFNSANIFVTSISPWPLIFFLHGAGERGDNGLASTELGLGRAIRLHSERFPAMVVMPQCRKKILWTQMLWLQKS
jgi:hypothetical protein